MSGRYNNNNNNNNKGRGQQRQIKKPQYDANGKRINEHIPKFISDKPWYYESDSYTVDSNSRKRKTDEEIAEENAKTKDRLKHQRLKPDEEIVPNNEPRKGLGIEDEFEKFEKVENNDNNIHRERKSLKSKSKNKNKRKTCENCGSVDHIKQDCLERPRKISFKFRDNGESSNTKRKKDGYLKHDDLLTKKDTKDWDTKRDRWHGYDVVNDYNKFIEDSKHSKKDQDLKDDQLLGLDAEEIEEMRELGLIDDIENNKTNGYTNKIDDSDETNKISVRSLDEKARYLESIKTGEEVSFNPKSRVFKDLKEGYLNERGQFIPYLKGEAEEFEKLKRFTNNIQNENKEKWELEADPEKPMTDLSFTTEVSPTALMLSIEEKKKEEELVRQAKRKELLKKYGALGNNGD